MKKLKKDRIHDQQIDVRKIENTEEPKLFKIATTNRREFLQTFAKGAIGNAGLVTLTKLIESCEDTEVRLGISHPLLENSNEYLNPKHYSYIGLNIISFLK